MIQVWPFMKLITGDFYGIIQSINGVLLVLILITGISGHNCRIHVCCYIWVWFEIRVWIGPRWSGRVERIRFRRLLDPDLAKPRLCHNCKSFFCKHRHVWIILNCSIQHAGRSTFSQFRWGKNMSARRCHTVLPQCWLFTLTATRISLAYGIAKLWAAS